MVQTFDHEMNVPTAKEEIMLPMPEMPVVQVHEVSMV